MDPRNGIPHYSALHRRLFAVLMGALAASRLVEFFRFFAASCAFLKYSPLKRITGVLTTPIRLLS